MNNVTYFCVHLSDKTHSYVFWKDYKEYFDTR